jgi:hypothetical protein
LVSVVAAGDYRPTDQAYAVKQEVTAKIDAHLADLSEVMATDLPAFNQLVRDNAVPAVIVDTDASTASTGTN